MGPQERVRGRVDVGWGFPGTDEFINPAGGRGEEIPNSGELQHGIVFVDQEEIPRNLLVRGDLGRSVVPGARDDAGRLKSALGIDGDGGHGSGAFGGLWSEDRPHPEDPGGPGELPGGNHRAQGVDSECRRRRCY